MIFCQSCLKPNTDDARVCGKCGNKLLVIGGNYKWEEPDSSVGISMDDHFLERISFLDETVNSVLEHVARISDTLDMVDRNAFVTRSGLSSLVETLKESNLLREELLYQRWEATMMEQMEEARFRDRFMQMKSRFLALFRGEATKKKSFLAQIEEAEFAIYSDRVHESSEILKKALKLDRKNYELAYYLAECCQLQGLNKEASQYLRTALKANPNHADSLLLLALIHYSEDKVEDAKDHLSRCLVVSPHHAVALLTMGSILTAEKRFEDARPFLEQATDLDPQAQGFYLLGLGARETGRLKEAIDYLSYATELDPEHEDAAFSLGLAYLKRGWTRKARACFSHALELNPNKVEFRQAAQIDEPGKQNDVEMDETSLNTLALANDLFHTGKLKQALPHYRFLLRKYPANYLVLSSFAVLNFSLRRFEESHKAASKILTLETPVMVRCVAFTMQMECYRAQGRYDDAIESLIQMKNEFPEGTGAAIANYGLALTMADTGRDLKQAETLARDALETSPPEFHHNLLDALGWVYFKQGHYEEALELVKSAINMHESLNHLYHFGMILLALNLQDEAFKVYERIVKLRAQTATVDDFIFLAISREMESAVTHPMSSESSP